ncbi:hypothetical protein [Streptomyces sp. MS2.AVA.5]|uniref:Uncharacterized protein n=1 Tax=Streptomyces achmelvichensis TaxID=3134111 RepID=A0ACC6PW60_9ACTN
MRESSRLQVYEVVEATDAGGLCIVRCVGGVARVGQTFTVEDHPSSPGSNVRLRLDRINRYGRDMDFFDATHAARVHLSGGALTRLVRASILTGEASAPIGTLDN